MTSDTPRTDVLNTELWKNASASGHLLRMLDFARQLERENAELRKDAERYRHLRECKGPVCAGVEQVGFTGNVQWLDTTDLDAVIDTAMTAEGKP